jgi:hypothetical protein
VPGVGRPGDPLWFVIWFAIGVIPGIYFHRLWVGVALGIVLGPGTWMVAWNRARIGVWAFSGAAIGTKNPSKHG